MGINNFNNLAVLGTRWLQNLIQKYCFLSVFLHVWLINLQKVLILYELSTKNFFPPKFGNPEFLKLIPNPMTKLQKNSCQKVMFNSEKFPEILLLFGQCNSRKFRWIPCIFAYRRINQSTNPLADWSIVTCSWICEGRRSKSCRRSSLCDGSRPPGWETSADSSPDQQSCHVT